MRDLATWRADLAETIAGIGRYLYGCQVITGDLACPASAGEVVDLDYAFLRRDPGPYRLQARCQGDHLYLRAPGGDWWGPLAPGAFVRVLPGAGLRDPATGGGGITLQYPGGAGAGVIRLVARDRGGIWDDRPNMEAFHYEPQVAGSYYADAYAAYAFAWLAAGGHGAGYREAAALALDFVVRVYPCYQPMVMDGCTHSDFRNPAFMEAVEEFLAAGAPPADLARWRGLYPRLVADAAYSPTNVYALRYHWLAARLRYMGPGAPAGSPDPGDAFRRVQQDQTPDGLIQDNNRSEISFGGYGDAHDLTYHLYALACLARGYDHLPLPEVWESLRLGAAFSLALTTPGGEASYLGRGANNVYHLAAAVYAYLYVAARDPGLAPALHRGARLIYRYLQPFQAPDGSFATALNSHPEERMGWNHCQTPYNALSAYFFIHALALLPELAREGPLPLEGPSSLHFPASRFAAAANRHLYLVVFGGNDLSYPWSGVHRTGVAGLAALGRQGCPSVLPVLEQSLREGEWSTSDLPDLVAGDQVAVPAGAGRLRVEGGRIYLDLDYGGLAVAQAYRPEGETVLLQTAITCRQSGPFRLVGAPGLSLRADPGFGLEAAGRRLACTWPGGALTLELLDTTLPGGGWAVLAPSSSARGWHRKAGWAVAGQFAAGETHRWTARLTLAP